MSARQSKRAQIEALGWKLEPIPRHFAAGFISDCRSGYVSPAFDDYKRPAAWVVTPPPGRNVSPRRFEGRSPNPGVRWAFEQAMTTEGAETSGVARLAALARAAGKSGVVVDGKDGDCLAPCRPDAELLGLCREIAGCDCISEAALQESPSPWEQRLAFRAMMDRVAEAGRMKDRLIPEALDLVPTTLKGAVAKLELVSSLFKKSRGRRAQAVRDATMELADLVKQTDQGLAASSGP